MIDTSKRTKRPAQQARAALQPARAVEALRTHPGAAVVPGFEPTEYRAFLADVAERGIVTPLEITPAGVVLDGQQRLRAARELGHAEVPVRVVRVEDEFEYALLAALHRRHLTPGQRAVLAVELPIYEQARREGKQRQRANLRNSPERATLPPRGRSRDLAAGLVNGGARTIQKAADVKQADPDLFERIRRNEISVNRAWNQLRQARLHARLGQGPPMPQGPFEVLLGDPPWQMGNGDGDFAPENHYRTEPTSVIATMRPPAAERAVLYLWSVTSMLPDALLVLEAWGFEFVSHMVWVKTNGIGPGVWARHRHELLLVGRRGGFSPPQPKRRRDSVLEAPRRAHSQKPDRLYELLEQMYPGSSKLELFARGTARPGWVFWGNEASND